MYSVGIYRYRTKIMGALKRRIRRPTASVNALVIMWMCPCVWEGKAPFRCLWEWLAPYKSPRLI